MTYEISFFTPLLLFILCFIICSINSGPQVLSLVPTCSNSLQGWTVQCGHQTSVLVFFVRFNANHLHIFDESFTNTITFSDV